MEQLTKLKTLATNFNLPIKQHDRLFYGKYLYKLECTLYRWTANELYQVNTIDLYGYKVDTEHHISFISTMRRFAKKQGDRVRVEGNYVLSYFTNNIDTLQRVMKYVERLQTTAEDAGDMRSLDMTSVSAFPGDITQRHLRFRKKHLPYKKYKFQLFSKRMSHDDVLDWEAWASQYKDSIKIGDYTRFDNQWGFIRTHGLWSGENLGYVKDEKMLQLVQFKLGSNINKIIEYQVRENNEL